MSGQIVADESPMVFYFEFSSLLGYNSVGFCIYTHIGKKLRVLDNTNEKGNQFRILVIEKKSDPLFALFVYRIKANCLSL